ncbi:hypothetical protein ScPMuIL_002639 [Solemya velum]
MCERTPRNSVPCFYRCLHIPVLHIISLIQEAPQCCQGSVELQLFDYTGEGDTFQMEARTENQSLCGWPPFDSEDSSVLLGNLDSAFLFAYAIGMFVSGHTAERLNIRYYLTFGMLGSGLFTAAFGFGYFWNIHAIGYFIVVQVVCGFLQATGWPCMLAIMGNWFGKSRRGFIMGVWNSHTSVGNILGSLIAGAFVTKYWGWSFAAPAAIVAFFGILSFLFLVPCEQGQRTNQVSPQANNDAGDIRLQESDTKSNRITPNGTVSHSTNSSDVLKSTTSNGTVFYTPTLGENAPTQPLLKKNDSQGKAISIWRAFMIPGVLEFSLCLFFAKLVSYTFLFWLPKYITTQTSYDAEKAADLSTLFDVGGIIGAIVAGVVSDHTGARATTCMVMLMAAAPSLYLYDLYGSVNMTNNIVLLIVSGALVNGPYGLITTAVAADLGTHKSLHGNSKALATVSAIIDGTGSIGAALGPLLTGLISSSSWNNVFYMLIGCDVAAFLLLLRLFVKEIRGSKCCR